MTDQTAELHEIFAELNAENQTDVLAYAAYLLDVQRAPGKQRRRFYICPTCFDVSEQQLECHDHLMVACNAENPEDCKPLMDAAGMIKSPAPRWFVRAVGWAGEVGVGASQN